MQIIRQTSFASTPWKNGGGITREAIRVPSVGDPFRWRVSVAQIDVSGPFSDFSGYLRNMVLLRGAGVRLMFADGRSALLREVGDSVEFDGAVATQCELVAGPCTDLNLIASKAMQAVEARVERLSAPLILRARPGESIVAFAMEGAVAVEGAPGDSALLEPWDLAVGSPGHGSIQKIAPVNEGSPPRVFLARLTDTVSSDGRLPNNGHKGNLHVRQAR